MRTIKYWMMHGVGITLIVFLMFVAPLVYLFFHSRDMVRQEAMSRAAAVLDNTALKVETYVIEVETATRNIVPQATANMQPETLLALSRRIVVLNPNVSGCSITAEPDLTPALGRAFSAYTVCEGDSISTVREGDYNYYEKEWYKACHDAKKAVWVDPYNDFNEGTLYATELISSYSVPLFGTDSTFIGVISTDISLPYFSKVIAAATPYEDSYCIMTGKKGNYLVHPNRDRLLYHTIFDDVNTRLQPDIVALGKAMTEGKEGNMKVNFDGRDCMVFYRYLPRTGWSIALVCPIDSVLGKYNRLSYFFVPLMLVGMLLLIVYTNRLMKCAKRETPRSETTHPLPEEKRD